MTLIEIVSVAFALAYLVLAIRQSLWCWPAALVSVALAAVVFFDARLYMESILQVYYFAMGGYGWWQWRRGGREHTGVEVHWWRWRQHAAALVLILIASVAFAVMLRRLTDAAFPFLDSLTTVAAVVTTYMVAKKVIENWIYWFVIDAILVYLYLERGLDWYAGLYAFYLVLVVIGFRGWWRSLYGETRRDDGHVGA